MLSNITSNSYKKKVYIETSEYIIRGYIYIPANIKKERMLSEVLNSGKTFIAVKNCELESKKTTYSKEIEEVDFLELNVASILLLKPINEN